MAKIKVGVLRGGPSSEYDVSLKTGNTVLRNLADQKYEEKYHLYDIFIDKSGTWHMYGAPVLPHEAVARVDVFFNALHGSYGEDGKVQKILDDHNARYTGSGALGSAIGMNKSLTKNVFKIHNIKTPYHIVLEKGNSDADPSIIARHAMTVFRSFSLPVVVKPASAGSSLGVSVVNDFYSIEPALHKAFALDTSVIVEEFIKGIEATVGVIEGFRGEELYVLPPVEIRHRKDFFDHESKYSDVDEIVPGNFTPEQKTELARLAQEAHRALGLRHYSRTDFIVSPRRGIYVLEANTLPGLADESILPKALASVGASMPDFLDHLVTLAYEQ